VGEFSRKQKAVSRKQKAVAESRKQQAEVSSELAEREIMLTPLKSSHPHTFALICG
jgi:hypothetical protein